MVLLRKMTRNNSCWIWGMYAVIKIYLSLWVVISTYSEGLQTKTK
jgi:hypothetical protein